MTVTEAAGMREKHLELIAELNAELERVHGGGGPKAVERHRGRGKLTARERVAGLCDPGTSFLELSPLAAHGLYDGAAPGASPSYRPSAASGESSRNGESGSSSRCRRSRTSSLP